MSPQLKIVLLVVIAAGLAAVAVHLLRKLRISPDERERRRRELIHRAGRLIDAELTDVQDATLYYQYSVGGVDYATSQDVTALLDRVPSDPAGLIGKVTIKYTPRNPANSILICESWSGLREMKKEKTQR